MNIKTILKNLLLIIVAVALGVLNAYFTQYAYMLSAVLFGALAGEAVIIFAVGSYRIGATSIPALLFLFLLVEIPTVSYGLYLLYKRFFNGQFHRYWFAMILIIFALTQFWMLDRPQRKKQLEFERKNPIEVGTKTYDFSQPLLFAEKQTHKNIVVIKDNQVVWVELLKEYPNYPKNISDLFLFEFDPKTSQGTTIQITNLEKTKYAVPENVGLYSGKIYWQQGDDLYTYNRSSKKPEFVASKISGFYGLYEDYILVTRASDPRALYLYDPIKKQELSLSSLSVDPFFNRQMALAGKNICYIDQTESRTGRYGFYNKIGVHNLESSKTTFFIMDIPDGDVVYPPNIIGCSDEYVAYGFGPSGPARNAETIEFDVRVYSLRQERNVFSEKFKGDDRSVSAKLVGEDFYYSPYPSEPNRDVKLYRFNLEIGKEKMIFSEKSPFFWNTDGDYIVYKKHTENEHSNLYMQRLSQ